METEAGLDAEQIEQDIFTQRALLLSKRQPVTYQASASYLHLRVQNENLLLDIHEIQRVQPLVNCSALPLAPQGLTGIFYFRGEMLSVLDLGYLLGLPLSQEAAYLLMTRTQPILALQVSEIVQLQALALADQLPYNGTSPYYQAMTTDGHALLSLEKLKQHPLIQSALKESL